MAFPQIITLLYHIGIPCFFMFCCTNILIRFSRILKTHIMIMHSFWIIIVVHIMVSYIYTTLQGIRVASYNTDMHKDTCNLCKTGIIISYSFYENEDIYIYIYTKNCTQYYCRSSILSIYLIEVRKLSVSEEGLLQEVKP